MLEGSRGCVGASRKHSQSSARNLLRWEGHLGRMENTRFAKELLWSALPEGAGRPGKRSNPMLSQVYHDFVQTLDLGGARRTFQNTRESEGQSLIGFSRLHACADRYAWPELIG